MEKKQDDFVLDPKIYGVKPKDARRRLERMGYEKECWDKIMGEGIEGFSFGSHEVRALITIARGTKPRLLGEVYQEERLKGGLPADRLADRAK